MGDTAKKLDPRHEQQAGKSGPAAKEGPRLVRGEAARRAAEALRPEEKAGDPEDVHEERRGLREAHVDTRLEGLSGMGATLGDVSEDKDQLGHLERQGLRREEQDLIERAIEPAEGTRPSDDAEERSLEPHEDKGMR